MTGRTAQILRFPAWRVKRHPGAVVFAAVLEPDMLLQAEKRLLAASVLIAAGMTAVLQLLAFFTA
jgi:hypothetical protein